MNLIPFDTTLTLGHLKIVNFRLGYLLIFLTNFVE
jgi:hypothetical protein